MLTRAACGQIIPHVIALLIPLRKTGVEAVIATRRIDDPLMGSISLNAGQPEAPRGPARKRLNDD